MASNGTNVFLKVSAGYEVSVKMNHAFLLPEIAKLEISDYMKSVGHKITFLKV